MSYARANEQSKNGILKACAISIMYASQCLAL